jgi:hypothetical protein
MNQNLFKLLMFINNIEIKIDSQVNTPMGCMISPPAYDIFIFLENLSIYYSMAKRIGLITTQ